MKDTAFESLTPWQQFFIASLTSADTLLWVDKARKKALLAHLGMASDTWITVPYRQVAPLIERGFLGVSRESLAWPTDAGEAVFNRYKHRGFPEGWRGRLRALRALPFVGPPADNIPT
jgi:hypothetical protein